MRAHRMWILFLLVLWGTGAASGHAAGQRREDAHRHATLDTFLQQLDASSGPDERVRVIVTLREGASGRLKAALAREAAILHDHSLINAVTAELSFGRLRALAASDEVASIAIDAPVHAGADTVGTLAENNLLPVLGLPATPSDVGKDVVVAVLDSGIVNHDQIPVSSLYDFLKGGANVKQYDDYGHGTHVAGVIASKDDKSDARYRSVGHGARLIGMKVLAADGSGYTSTVINAIEFAIKNKSALKIDVINLSLGHPIFEPAATDPLVQAVERAVSAGIVVVVAAGNEGMNRTTGEVGYAGITSPGNAPSAISVGAVDTKKTLTHADDEVAPFSSRGPSWYDGYLKPDVVAPGRRITSFMAKGSYLYKNYPGWYVDVATRTYMSLSGTSMAAAVTSGVVADIIRASRAVNAGRTLTPNTVKAILEFSAAPLPNVDALTQGAGAINAAGAVALARAIDTGAPLSSWWLSTGVTPSTTLANGEELSWSEHVVWGDQYIVGNYVYTNDPAWGLHVVWGDHVVWGTRVVWGTPEESLVWGDCYVWGTHVVWGTNVLAYDSDGTLLYGDSINWQNVTADRLVWGTLDANARASAAQAGTLWNPVF